MTKVKIKLNKNKVKISVTGHSLFATYGEPDLVCASVSTLSTTLAQCLLDAEPKGYIKDYEYNLNEGDATYKFEMLPGGKEMINAIVYTVFTGFALLENQFPQNVQVIK